ncbi:MAG: flagellar protein FlaG [Deltaproteobacteria bacterium]|nr:flagellar protein FlaG [Deltaproteobacteria bacterium]
MLVESVSISQPPGVTPVTASRPEAAKSPANGKELDGEHHGNAEFLQAVLEVAQNHFQVSGVSLDFRVDDDAGCVKVSVKDKETGKVIREIPPDQVLHLMAKLDEMMGILFDAKA